MWIIFILFFQSIWCTPNDADVNNESNSVLVLNHSEAFSNDFLDLFQEMFGGPSKDHYDLVQFVLRENRFETMKWFPNVIRILSKDDSNLKALKKLINYPYLIFDEKMSLETKPELHNIKKNPPYLVSRDQLSTIVSEMLATDQVAPDVGRFWVRQAIRKQIKPSMETLFEWACRNGILDQVIQITNWHLRPVTEEFWSLGFLNAVKHSQVKVVNYLLQKDVLLIFGNPETIYMFMALTHAHFQGVPEWVRNAFARFKFNYPYLWPLPKDQHSKSMEDLIFDSAKQWNQYDLYQIRSSLVFACRFGHRELFKKLMSLRGFANDLVIDSEFFQSIVEDSITYKAGMTHLIVETMEPILSVKGTRQLITSFQAILSGLKFESGVEQEFKFLANYALQKGYNMDVGGITDLRDAPALTETTKWIALQMAPQRLNHLVIRDILLTGEWEVLEELAKKSDPVSFRAGVNLAFQVLLKRPGLDRFLLDGLASMILYTSILREHERLPIYRTMLLDALRERPLIFRRLMFHLTLSLRENDLIPELLKLFDLEKMIEMKVDLGLLAKELKASTFLPKGLFQKMDAKKGFMFEGSPGFFKIS